MNIAQLIEIEKALTVGVGIQAKSWRPGTNDYEQYRECGRILDMIRKEIQLTLLYPAEFERSKFAMETRNSAQINERLEDEVNCIPSKTGLENIA